MWLHLLPLGLIDGAGGSVVPPPEPVVQINGAGFLRYDRKHYKYKYKLQEDALQAIEQAAETRIKSKQITTLQSALERMGVVYHDAYKAAFIEILAQLRAEQDAEDEQIAQIIAALL